MDDAASAGAAPSDHSTDTGQPVLDSAPSLHTLSGTELRAGQILQIAHQLRGLLAAEDMSDLNELREHILDSVERICEKATEIRTQATRTAGRLTEPPHP